MVTEVFANIRYRRYMVYDALKIDGVDVTGLPFTRRTKMVVVCCVYWPNFAK